jgi:hypothetical protein
MLNLVDCGARLPGYAGNDFLEPLGAVRRLAHPCQDLWEIIALPLLVELALHQLTLVIGRRLNGNGQAKYDSAPMPPCQCSFVLLQVRFIGGAARSWNALRDASRRTSSADPPRHNSAAFEIGIEPARPKRRRGPRVFHIETWNEGGASKRKRIAGCSYPQASFFQGIRPRHGSRWKKEPRWFAGARPRGLG